MTAAPTRPQARTVDAALAGRVEELLVGDPTRDGVLAHQHLLDALDRRDHARLIVWPGDEPRAVVYASPSGTLLVAGDPGGGEPLATAASDRGWRVLLGDAELGRAILAAGGRGMLRRRGRAREQRLMGTRTPTELAAPAGLRRARLADEEQATELAARLHVEDQMGPPLSRSSRAGVAGRLRESIRRGDTWVVDDGGEIVAKVDVALRNPRCGAQLAGVYVVSERRGQGLASRAVAAISRHLVAEGLPGITLHVRADNIAGIRAYERAGFEDLAAWVLALR